MEVDIVDIGYNMEGIAKQNGAVIFVANTLIGEKVEAEIVKNKNSYMIATAKKILVPSIHRTVAPCPYYEICGGCSLQHASYDYGLLLKTQTIQNTLNKMKINCHVLPCLPSEKQYGYRNKMVFQVGEKLGMFEEGSHQMIFVSNCLLGGAWTKKVIEIFNNFIAENHLTHYNQQTGQGLLRYVVVREVENQFLFVVVINDDVLPKQQNLVDRLKTEFENFGLFLNVNTQKNGEIMSNKYIHIYGKKTLTNNEFGIEYQVGPYSFLQVNQDIKTKVYQSVLNQIGGEIVDAYSGAGLLSAIMSKKATHVYAIELNKEATLMAEKLKKENKIRNLTNLNGDCKIMLGKVATSLNNFTLVLDPPRAGCDKQVIETINKTKPNKILYISCNAATLARDLCNIKGYQIKLVQPYDMFAQTKHVEILVCLVKNNLTDCDF